MGLQINVTYDASAASAPTGFKTAVQAAVAYWESVIASSVTVNIVFGYGVVDGQPMDPGSLGESVASHASYSYAKIAAAMGSAATSYDDAVAMAHLRADPANGAPFYVSTGEAKALGLFSGSPTAIDGWVGLATDSPFTFDPDNRSVAGTYDAVGALEHEISEILGRISFAGEPSSPGVTPLDLFRIAYQPAGANGAYFSVDGQRNLMRFNVLSHGDPGDWAYGDQDNDSFTMIATPGVAQVVSQTDLRVMDVLGFAVAPHFATTAGDDYLVGGPGADRLDGGAGADLMFGGPGDDTYVVDALGDTVGEAPGQGTDTVEVHWSNGLYTYHYYLPDNVENLVLAEGFSATGNALDNLMTGNEGTNVLDGGPGDDTLRGEGGDDTLIGSAGDDHLNGGAGADILNGDGGIDTSVYSVAAAAASVTRHGDGSWTVNAGADGADTLSNIELLQFADRSISLVAELAQTSDYTGMGRSDLLIQNSGGAVVMGQVSDGRTDFTVVAALGPEWSFKGAGEFLGDGVGRSESLVWTHLSTPAQVLIENTNGAVVAGALENGQVSYTQVGALGPEWAFKGVGDFLQHGDDQFLIENTSGAVVVGEVVGGQASYTPIAALGPEWSFKGGGDFLGDGRSDFLIENTAGAVVIGEVAGGQTHYTQVAALGPEWTFVGAGDVLGDGHTGFLLEGATGAVVFGEVVNGQASYSQLGGLGPEWTFRGVADFLGAGHDQFLIENQRGAVFVGDWQGGQVHYTQVTALGPEWQFHL